MANKDAAFGFKPVRSLSGGEFRTQEYAIAATYATSLFTGTPVLGVTAGGSNIAVESSGPPGHILGSFGGCFYTDPSTLKPTFRNFFPASTSPGDAIAFVCDDPDQMYVAQQDSVGANAVAANLNENANLVFGAGSTTTGISGVEIDSSTLATTATHQVRLISFYDTPSNDATANNSEIVVKINNSVMNGGTGTAGV